MRTKSLLLMAAVSAVATAGAFAQGNVYSVNAVGYVNKVVEPGFNIVANPLNASANTLANLFPTVPAGTTIYRYVNGNFAIYVFAEDDFGNFNWGANEGVVLNPGEGVFMRNGTQNPFTVTFVGEVPQGTLNNPVPAGFSLRASVVPQSGQLDTVLEYPATAGDRIYRFVGGNYTIATFAEDDFGNFTWDNPQFATPGVAEGFWVLTSQAKTWTRNFSATN